MTGKADWESGLGLGDPHNSLPHDDRSYSTDMTEPVYDRIWSEEVLL